MSDDIRSSVKEMMDRDARTSAACRAGYLAEWLLVRSAAKFREADLATRAVMITEAFAAAEAFVAEANRRFEVALRPAPPPPLQLLRRRPDDQPRDRGRFSPDLSRSGG